MSWLGVCLPRLPLDAQLRGCGEALEGQIDLAICDHHVVVLASDAALERGVRPGMPKATAQALSPDLLLKPRDLRREHDALKQAACWALQFTPRVSLQFPSPDARHGHESLTHSGMLLEIGASLRLFGGRDSLIESLRAGLASLGFHATISGAPNPSAAWLMALVHDGVFAEDEVQLRRRVASLPVSLFEEAAMHLDTLGSVGVRTVRDLLQLPRAGIAHRFGKRLLDALDRVLGRIPEPRRWFEAPEIFEARLELLARVETTEALMSGARRLITELAGWLMARHGATRGFELGAEHDEPPASLFQVRFAAPARAAERMANVLGEVLNARRLRAPVHTLRLRCNGVEPLREDSADLFPTSDQQAESLGHLVERLQARLGREQVQRLLTAEDHRPEAAYRIATFESGSPSRTIAHRAGCLPRPIWLLPRPIPIGERNNRPFWRGPLTLLAGPERIESGWWDGRPVQRDYFIATDENDHLLWLYRERPTEAGSRVGWFIQGRFG